MPRAEEAPATSQTLQSARQRVRITFARGENTRYVGHLDMVRTWERIIRRAELPIAYSEGFNPHPRLTFAAALPVGCTSDQEVLDVILARACDRVAVRRQLDGAVPQGIRIVDVIEVPYSAPALQTQTRAAEYTMTSMDDVSTEEAEARVRSLLDAPTLERERRNKAYDLRPLILDLWVEACDDGRGCVGMLLKAEEGGTGRPDEVAAALGWDATAVRIHRRRLIFA